MRLFITGTDTGVGKTAITAALATALRSRGGLRALKPLATGLPGPPGEDAEALGLAAGHPPLCHRWWPTPAAPSRAAGIAGEAVELDSVLRWIRAQDTGGPLLVEGVGGWMVPLGPGTRVEQLAQQLGLPVLLVAANRLGVLNHSLLSATAIRAAGLPLAALVLNDLGAADPALAAWNLADLRAELPGLPVLPFPRCKGGAEQQAAGEALLAALQSSAATSSSSA
jgi:dethiobiotin synthetase